MIQMLYYYYDSDRLVKINNKSNNQKSKVKISPLSHHKTHPTTQQTTVITLISVNPKNPYEYNDPTRPKVKNHSPFSFLIARLFHSLPSLNHQIRTVYAPASSTHTPHPWRLQFSGEHALCM